MERGVERYTVLAADRPLPWTGAVAEARGGTLARLWHVDAGKV